MFNLCAAARHIPRISGRLTAAQRFSGAVPSGTISSLRLCPPARFFGAPRYITSSCPRSAQRTTPSDDDAPPSVPTAAVASNESRRQYFTSSPLLDAGLTAVVGLAVAFVGGIFYVQWYKSNVLRKVEIAFEPGSDPALTLANYGIKRSRDHAAAAQAAEGPPASTPDSEDLDWTVLVRREEQATIDAILHGKEHGHYYLIMGPKGVGKGSMIFEAMRKVDADGLAICEAHEDLEVFRLRLGKALNYEYNEDSQTGLFQRRDPREGGARLDIERALNKLEKVALRLAPKRKRPLVLIINNIQVFHHNDESRNLLIQLQQRAEAWAQAGLVTIVFSSDDFWPYPLLRRIGNRMQVISLPDLNPNESLLALRQLRREITGKQESEDVLLEALSVAGGRLAHLNKIARARDPIAHAKFLVENEKGWILSEIGLIPDCDDDVMDEQKVCASSWLLLQELVKQYREAEKLRVDAPSADGGPHQELLELPAISYYRARQIMTRADFLELLDNKNIISIDPHHMVRPDSMVLFRAAMEVVEEDGFQELLDNVRARIDEIESLHRTAELAWKASSQGDLLRVYVEKKPPPKLEGS